MEDLPHWKKKEMCFVAHIFLRISFRVDYLSIYAFDRIYFGCICMYKWLYIGMCR